MLTQAHQEAGEPSYRTIEHALFDHLGQDGTPTSEKIRLYHRGPLPKQADYELLLALTRYYDKPTDWLGDEVAARARRMLVLAGGRADPPGDAAGGRRDTSEWAARGSNPEPPGYVRKAA